MFKKIPGNHDYIISLNGEVRTNKGYSCNLPIIANKISISLYNKPESLDLIWLALLAHFEINLPKYFKSINFVNCNPLITRSNSGKFAIFTKPIEYIKGYRIIPNYTNYAITKEGKILEIEHNRELTNIDEKTQYPNVVIYDPDKSTYKSVLLHRLVALAWVHNDDFIEKPIVNHIDGNKRNYYYKNLEWCSYSENNSHAYTAGLKNDNRLYKVKDHLDGEIKEYNSFSNLCKDIGLHKTTKFKDKIYKRKSKLIKNRYEIKLLDDNTPWLSEQELKNKYNKYTIEVTFEDGHSEMFYTIVDVMKRLKVWGISYNIDEIIRVAKSKYPGIKFHVIKNFTENEVQALDLTTMEVIEAKSIQEMSRKLNIGFSTIHQAIRSKKQYNCKGYVFRFKSEDPWDQEINRHPNAPKKLRAFNEVTKEIIEFPSLQLLLSAFKTSAYIVRDRIKNNTKLGDWVLSEINYVI